MKIYLLVLFVFLTFSAKVWSQSNLIPNGDCEQILEQTEGHAFLNNLKFWFNPSGEYNELRFGTPDHLYVPENTTSKWFKPKNGNSAIGIVTFLQRIRDYREYVSIKLKRPLQVGKVYKLSFFISSGNEEFFGNVPTSNIGIKFDLLKPFQNGYKPIYGDFITLYDSSFYQSQWEEINYQFEAKESFQFLTIGNFENDSKTKQHRFRKDPDPQSYIFIDDVSLVEVIPSEKSQKEEELSSNETQKVVIDTKKIKVQHKFFTKNSTVKIKIWDNKNIDGDIITLMLNQQVVLYKYKLSKKKKKVKIKLPNERNIQLIMIAENLGNTPPNTAAIRIKSGNSNKLLRLESDLSSSGSIQIVLND